MISQAKMNCREDVSERAAQAAREKYPDSQTTPFSYTWFRRQHFLRENRWLFFDVDHNKKMSFEEYHSWIWASFLVGATPGSCVLTKNQYLQDVLSRPTDSINSWNSPDSLRLAEASWSIVEPDGRDFLVKDDLKYPDYGSFGRADVFHRGYLTVDQTF